MHCLIFKAYSCALIVSRCCIIISFGIYLAAGREIFAKRQQLRGFNNLSRPAIVEVANPFTSFKTTEIHVTSELATMSSPFVSNGFFPQGEPDAKTGMIKSKGIASRRPSNTGYDQYSVTIGSTPLSPSFEAPPVPPKGTTPIQQRNNRVANEANAAAFGYTKVALLFFVSLLVTWVSVSLFPPSNVNLFQVSA